VKSCVNPGFLLALRRLFTGNGCLQSQQIALDSEARDLSAADGGDEGSVPEFLPGVDVGEVDFDGGNGHGREGIPERDAGVGIGGGVEDDGVEAAAGVLDPGDEFAFVIGLAEVDFGVEFGCAGPDEAFDVRERVASVDFGLAGAEEIEVRSVQEEYLHGRLEKLGWGEGGVDGESRGRPRLIPRSVNAVQARGGT